LFLTLEVAKEKLSLLSIYLLGSSLWLFFLLGSISYEISSSDEDAEFPEDDDDELLLLHLIYYC
jgi:hypothetical protein